MPLLGYRYFQPADGRYHYASEAGGELPDYALLYAGKIPAAQDETTEELLDRLLMRHSSPVRPHGRNARAVGTGDVLDLGPRGFWQVLSCGFRSLPPERLRVECILPPV